MNDMIIRAAQDPSCILAVTPDRGGSWWAALRPDTPRNFAEKPMTWTSFSTMIATVTETNWKFAITYTLNSSDGTQRIFTGGSNAGPISVFKSSDGQFYIRTMGGNGTIIQANPEGDFSGSHIVEIIAENGLYEIKYDGETVRAVHDVATTPVLIHGDEISSQFNGTIDSAGFLCGDVVWQASHGDLFETNNPWPSATLCNFAEEPTAFYDCQSICSEKIDPSHDYRFLFDSEIVSDKIECSMFYAGAAGFPFGIYCHHTNQINCFTNLFRFSSSPSSQYTNTSVYNGESRLQGRHVIEMEIAGNSLKTYLDGVLINRPSGFVRTGVATCDLPQCNSGYVYKIQIEDLTTGKTVWSYPSEAERVQLITKTNVRTDRGVFEAASPDRMWRVDTPLRWKNLNSATIIVRATADDCPETIFSFGMPANPNYSAILLRRSSENQLYASLLGTRADGSSVYKTITADFSPDVGREYCFVLVFDIDGDFMSLYVDGNLLSSIALLPLVTIVVDGQTLPGFMLGTTSSSDAINSGTTVSSALVFDRALTAAEIAALTPTNN